MAWQRSLLEPSRSKCRSATLVALGPRASQERIFDVAVSDGREVGEDRRVTTFVGSTVRGAAYTNTIGDAVFGAFWEDRDIDPGETASYYVRGLEIRTPACIAYGETVFGKRDASNRRRCTASSRPVGATWIDPRETR
ncbi:DUF3604 domain-containing protein [Tropicimonas marinistellae]|uniref:DUF3604 domain-containing protein n=1 Tax=Tropicimonas marinistellae TaxID=1739787 RepID=UPI00098FBF37